LNCDKFTVRGTLGQVTGSAESADGKLTRASLAIDLTALSTNNPDRDTHVKSADFLNVDAHPSATFESTNIVSKSDTQYTITGDFSLAGQTHPATIEAEFVAPVTDPWGNYRAGVTGTGVIKRSEWGITYNNVMETGHLMLSDDIKFTFDVQATIVP
jgi:polyisoprenoid-binding protein YceI